MFRLPHPNPYRLERPPLAVATVQVRFPLTAQFQSLAGVAPFQAEVAALLPYMELVQQQQLAVFVVAPVGAEAPQPPASQTTVAWKFTNDEGWVLSLEAGSATLSVGGTYPGFEDFLNRWQVILAALHHVRAVGSCTRVGTRYLDLIDIGVSQDHEWVRWLRPELTGWLGAGILDEGTTPRVHITQSQLTSRPFGALAGLPYDVQGVIRHGLVPTRTALAFEPLSLPLTLESDHFLLEIDLFAEGRQPFDVDQLTAQFRTLHDELDSFFRWSFTREGERQFGLVEA